MASAGGLRQPFRLQTRSGLESRHMNFVVATFKVALILFTACWPET
jgi:hypothetical protein